MQSDENDDALSQEPVPVLNPNWQEALDKVMHTSLMSKNANQHTQPLENEDEEGLSDIEEGLEVGIDTLQNDDDDDDDDNDGRSKSDT